MFDGQALGQQIAAMIKVAIVDAIAPMQEQMKTLELAQLTAPGTETIKSLVKAEQATWALDFERRATEMLQKAFEAVPKPRDAFQLDSFDFSLGEDGRTVTVKLGDFAKSLTIPAILDRGVFHAEATYTKGDAVSWGGSLWIAQTDAPTGTPGAGETGWRLAVKKGRDAK